MAYSQNQTNLDAASWCPHCGQKNPELHSALREMRERIGTLEKQGGTQATESDQQLAITPAPPLASFDVSASGGTFIVHIRNPEFVVPVTLAKLATQRNQLRSVINHVLECSLNTQFDSAGDVQRYGPSTQTYWEISRKNDGTAYGSQTRTWRLTSTFDGKTFSKPLLRLNVTS